MIVISYNLNFLSLRPLRLASVDSYASRVDEFNEIKKA